MAAAVMFFDVDWMLNIVSPELPNFGLHIANTYFLNETSCAGRTVASWQRMPSVHSPTGWRLLRPL